MAKKKILIFVDWYLPGFRAGGPIRSVANMVAHLKNDFEFSIATRDTDYCETVPYSNIKSNEWNLLPDGTRVFYLSKNKLSYKEIKKLITSESFDIVYLNSFFSYYFTILPLFIFGRIKSEIKFILAPRGMLAPSALSIKSFKKNIYLFYFKKTGVAKKIIFHASSESEKKDIENVFGRKVKIFVALNLSKINSGIQSKEIEKKTGELKLINIARISEEKNLLFALEVLKEVKQKVVFDFYGTIYNRQYWEKCEEMIKVLPSNIVANYKGVLENSLIEKTFSDYHFMFMPTRGENFGHIISEAMSCGCPVIISDNTPWKNLEEKKAGWDIPLNSNQKFIEIIERCVAMNQQEYNEWSKNAFIFSVEFQNKEESIEQNKILFLSV